MQIEYSFQMNLNYSDLGLIPNDWNWKFDLDQFNLELKTWLALKSRIEPE